MKKLKKKLKPSEPLSINFLFVIWVGAYIYGILLFLADRQ